MPSLVHVVSASAESSLRGCAGFLQQFAAVIDDEKPHLHLGKALAELSGGRQPNRVICTGHSLGGALATLGASASPISCHASVWTAYMTVMSSASMSQQLDTLMLRAEYLLAACTRDLQMHDLAYGMQARPGRRLSIRTRT